MTPQFAMREIVSEAESVSGYPVHVQEVASLPVLATVKAATADVPFTLVRVRADTGRVREYVVSFQCGFVLRQAQLPPDERWDVAASPKGRRDLTNVVRKDFGDKIGKSARDAFVNQLLGGLITQLRSIPIGLRVDQWIADTYPILADQQRQSIEGQLQDNAAVLSPEVKQMVPRRVYSASVAMNAAMAVFWANAWEENTLAVPYKATGFARKADALLHLFNETPVEPQSDRLLIDSWATKLNIAGWHAFVRR